MTRMMGMRGMRGMMGMMAKREVVFRKRSIIFVRWPCLVRWSSSG
jgi:hypothetical protein